MLTDEDFNRIHEDMAIRLGHAINADVQALLEEVWALRRLVAVKSGPHANGCTCGAKQGEKKTADFNCHVNTKKHVP